MTLLLVFSLTLIVAVLVSGYARKSILSTSVLFLATGLVVGWERLGWVSVAHDDQFVIIVAELALFSVLFTDGMLVSLRELAASYRLPGRALLLGLPLTLLLFTLCGRLLLGLTWVHAALLGAALSPSDPVFASAIVGQERVPRRLRRLLHFESGMNDGLALPVVIALLAVAGHDAIEWGTIGLELLGGVATGIVIPWVVLKLEQSRLFKASPAYEPINAFAIGLLVYAVTKTLHWNEFLAAFAAGVTVATVGPRMKEAFRQFGEVVAELLKLAALLIFAVLFSFQYFDKVTVREVLFVVAALLLVRPLAVGAALMGTSLTWKEWLAAAWFGPRGFASVVYGLLILQRGIRDDARLFHLIGLVVASSILAHTSTDLLVARWFQSGEEKKPAEKPPAEPAEEQPLTAEGDSARARNAGRSGDTA